MNSSLPLANRRIVVTRAEEQSESIASELSRHGANVILVPTVRIIPAELSDEEELHISSFRDYDVIIFSSANAARNFFHHLPTEKLTVKKPFIVAIGKKTADAISEFGFKADFIPGKSTSEELIGELAGLDWHEKRVLQPAGNLSGDEIAEFVESNGGLLDKVVVYNTVPNDSIDANVQEQIRAGQFDIVVFYSPSQVKAFLRVFGSEVLRGKEIAVIGPTTKKSAESHGLSVDIVPANSTTEDLVTSLIEHENN